MNNNEIFLEELDFDQKAIGEHIKKYGNHLDAEEKIAENRMRFDAWREQVESKE